MGKHRDHYARICTCKSCAVHSSMPQAMCKGRPCWVWNLPKSMLTCWDCQRQLSRNSDCNMLFMAQHQTTSMNRCFSDMGCVLLQRCRSTWGWLGLTNTKRSWTCVLFSLQGGMCCWQGIMSLQRSLFLGKNSS